MANIKNNWLTAIFVLALALTCITLTSANGEEPFKETCSIGHPENCR